MKKVVSAAQPLTTLNEMWLQALCRHGERPVVCSRPTARDRYVPLTYREMETEVLLFGKGLIEMGLQVQEPVPLIAGNGPRWLICDLAILGCRACDVPVSLSSTTEELFRILDHSQARIALVGDEPTLQRVLALRERLPRLQSIVLLDPAADPVPPDPPRGILSYRHILELGARAPEAAAEVFHRRRRQTRPGDIATILYTSGSTGLPKGVVLTHANLMHNANHLPFLLRADCSGRFLSILPIWHVLERASEYAALRVGGSIWYSGSRTFLKDLAEAQPSWMVSVPRIWIAVYHAVLARLRRDGRQALFDRLYRHSLRVIQARRCRQGRQGAPSGRAPEIGRLAEDEARAEIRRASFSDILCHRLADLLIYRGIRARFGRRFDGAVSGGAALPAYIDDFFEVIGITLLEGYGLTEASPVLCLHLPEHRVPYTVGRPLPGTSIRLLDREGREMPDGEKGVIWASGPQVTPGYYRNPEETARVLRADPCGQIWLDTGDLGLRTATGDIVVIGRVKDTVVLATGENVEPGPIEAALLRSGHIDQVMICGQDREYLSALIVPNPELLAEECRRLGIEPDARRIDDPGGQAALRRRYLEIVAGLVSEPRPRAIAFTRPFSREDGTLTATFKLCRERIAERDEALIRGMYARHPSAVR